MKKRSLGIMLAMGLVLSLFVAALGPASAQDNGNDNGIDTNATQAFFPWVANGSDADGTGPYYGTITLQNLNDGPNVIDVYVADEDDGWALADTIVLQQHGSITLAGSDLFDEDVEGGAVWAQGWASFAEAGELGTDICVVTANLFGDGDALIAAIIDAGLLDDEDLSEEEIEAILEGLEDIGQLLDILNAAGIGTTDVEVFFGISEAACDAIGTAPGVNSFFFDNVGEVDGIDAQGGAIAGVYKQVSGEGAATGAATSGSDSIVDGYTALNGNQITTGTNEYVLPIVQTNNNWNTQIRVSNLSDGGTTPYTITVYESGQSGVAGESTLLANSSFSGGETDTYNLLDAGFEPGFVGVAFIETNAPVGAVAERVKAETNMLIMNTSRPVFQDQGTQVAPLVFQDWNFWNTGISAANTGAGNSQVTFNYHPPLSGFTQDTRNIAERSMEYVYRPGGQEVGIGVVGAAILNSTHSHHAVVDEVKYFGDLPDVGHAMGYNTVPVEDHAVVGEGLALPLFQKGAAESGDTSGIQLFNASADSSVTFEATIYNTAGNPVAPTIAEPITATLDSRENFTIYAHDLQELPSGFQGSVIIRVTGGGGLLSAVSNNVNYDVQYDGSAAYNLVNFDLPVEPEPPVLPDPELVIDPAESLDNEFLSDEVLAAEYGTIVADLDLVWPGDAADWEAYFLGLDDLSLAAIEADLTAIADVDATAPIAEVSVIVDALAAAALNTHTVQAYVQLGDDVLDDVDFDIEIQVLNEFGVQVGAITDFDLDVEDGVATIVYVGQPAFGGSDSILITATVGDDDDDDNGVVLEGEAVKTWILVEADDNGDNGDNGNGIALDVE